MILNINWFHYLTFILLLWVIQTKMTFLINGNSPWSHSDLVCLQNHNQLQQYVIKMTVYARPNYFVVSNVQSAIANQIYPPPMIYLELHDWINQNQLPQIVQVLVKEIQKYKVRMLWLAVPNSNLIWGSCDIFQRYYDLLKSKTNYNIGITGNSFYWDRRFGSKQACSVFSNLPLMAVIEPFKSFGGWNNCDLILGHQMTFQCIENDKTMLELKLCSQMIK